MFWTFFFSLTMFVVSHLNRIMHYNVSHQMCAMVLTVLLIRKGVQPWWAIYCEKPMWHLNNLKSVRRFEADPFVLFLCVCCFQGVEINWNLSLPLCVIATTLNVSAQLSFLFHL